MRRMMIMLAVAAAAVLALPVRPAGAAQYDIKEMTPAVKTALEGRRTRFEELNALKAEGKIGETNRGYVEALADQEALRSLVDAENADRREIYQTIAEQNGLTGQLGVIEDVFAAEQRERAPAGTKVQAPDGSWQTK